MACRASDREQLNLSKLRKVRLPSLPGHFGKETTAKQSERKRGGWMRKISGGQVKQRTEQTCFSSSDTQTLGQLPFTPHAGKPAYWDQTEQLRKTHPGQHRSPYAPLLCCPTWQQASGSDFSKTSERFVCLHLTLVKVAGANWSTSSTAAYSHLERPGSCFLDIFTAFNIVLPPPLLLSVMQVHNSCITDCRQERFFWLQHIFGHEAEQHPNIPREHFLDICCSLFTPWFQIHLLFFFSFLSCRMHRLEQWGK